MLEPALKAAVDKLLPVIEPVIDRLIMDTLFADILSNELLNDERVNKSPISTSPFISTSSANVVIELTNSVSVMILDALMFPCSELVKLIFPTTSRLPFTIKS